MADVLKSLLQAYYADIQTESQAGGELDFLMSSFIVQSPHNLPTGMEADLPCALISFGLVPITPMCVPMVNDQKFYNITISIIKEGYGEQVLGIIGDTYETGIIDMMTTLETRYRRQTFDLTDIVHQSQIDYTVFEIPPFLGRYTAQGHINLVHDYIDMRSS